MRARPAAAARLRVAHVITALTTGGAEWMLLRLLQTWDRDTLDGEVISLKDANVMGARMRDAGVTVRALDLSRRPSPLALMRLWRWLARGRFDVVQTWMTHADLVGGLAARAARLPVVWGLHVGPLDAHANGRGTMLAARVNARLSRRVPARIIACSETSRRAHAALGYDDAKMVVIPNGFDTSRFRPDAEARVAVRRELGLADDALVLGRVGRFQVEKDHRNFVAAARLLLARRRDVHFVLCGRDVTRDNTTLAEWIGDDRAHFHILGERGDVPRLTAAFDLACSPSYVEAFPLVIGEAMACGVPVVATDCGDSKLMLGGGGRVVPARDPRAFADACEALLAAGPDARARIGATGRRRVQAKYELRAIAARYETIYRAVAGGGVTHATFEGEANA
jgi:glycosyltransferase involved in cell wall biosynthesis